MEEEIRLTVLEEPEEKSVNVLVVQTKGGQVQEPGENAPDAPLTAGEGKVGGEERRAQATSDAEPPGLPGIRVENLSPRQLLELDACTRCSECVQWCPVYAQDPKEDLTPRAKARAFRKIMAAQEGILSVLAPPESWLGRRLGRAERQRERIRKFVQGLYECSTCGQCHFVCPSYIDTVELWEGIRKSIVGAGCGPLENHKALTSSVKSYDNPWQQPRSTRDKWAKRAFKQKQIAAVPKNLGKERAEVLYFVGCTASFDVNIKDVAVNTVRMLQACGVDFGILGVQEKCCGSVLLRVGDPEYERLARQNIETFNSLGIGTLVTSCAGCYKTISQDYPKVGRMNFEILHMVQFIDRLIQAGRLQFRHPVPMKVTYHDPCHLGRASGIFDAPRRILKAIPGIEFVEIERHHENSRCCGAGGGLKAGFPEIQQKMAQARVRDAVATGATDFVTACPFCYQGLLVGIAAEGAPLRMRDITEIITRALGAAQEGRDDKG